MTEVACCRIVNREGMILLAQKTSGYWEFPGGKVNSDETLFQCAEREILEELGIIINAVKAEESRCIVEVGSDLFELILVSCDYLEGDLALTEHLEAMWCNEEDISALNLSPGDQKLWKQFYN